MEMSDLLFEFLRVPCGLMHFKTTEITECTEVITEGLFSILGVKQFLFSLLNWN